MPYGVLGVSLLTALMPRMSRAAAEGRITDGRRRPLTGHAAVSRSCCCPVSALLTLFGTQLGIALFSFGRDRPARARPRLGATLAASAFGLLPFAVMMLQARVFYALKDSRTPTLLQLVIVVVKIPLLLPSRSCCPPQWVVLGLAAANGLSFVVGWILGQVLLRRRLGPLGTGPVLGALLRMAVASVVGAGLAFGVVLLVGPALPAVGPVGGVVDRTGDRRGDRRARRRRDDAGAPDTGGGGSAPSGDG